MPDILPKASQIDLPEKKTKHTHPEDTMDKPTRPMIFAILPDRLPRASQIDLPEQKTKHTPKGRIFFPMKKPTRTLIFEILPDILPTAIK